MILLTFKSPDGYRLGAKTERGIVDLAQAQQAVDGKTTITPDAFFAENPISHERLAALIERALNATGSGAVPAWLLDEDDVEPGPCVPNPGKIICIGLNYRRHAAESGMQPPKTPVLFSKFNNTIAAPGEAVPLPSGVVEYDYEAELVAVIGRQGKNIPEAQALDYVFGYCNGNDISARDLQMLTGQWLLGKTLDKFLPIGPYLVTADEIADPQNLGIRCWLNGELRQNSNTGDMIFSVQEIISYVSRYMTLEPGDIISTGTPEGVILGMEEKNWMKPGDEVTVELDGLGVLTNIMAAGS
jgi:2-keto-4-pentenoate hydratase/2-oxohepta-3-ene-1,7-dioic acid hydratase in catechol pathway